MRSLRACVTRSPQCLQARLPACLLAAALLLLAPPPARSQQVRALSGDGYTTSVHVYVSAVTYKDSVWCAKRGVTVWEPGYVSGLRADPAVYLQGSQMPLDVDLSTTPDDGAYVNRPIDFSAKYKGVPVTVTPSSYTVTIPDGGTVTRSVIISGLPNNVTMGDLELKIAYYPPSNPQQTLYSTATDKVYLVCAAPLEPMDVVWVDVLNDTCDWANGDSTAGDVARDLTLGLFFAQRFPYPNDTSTNWCIGSSTTFRLADFFNAFGPPPNNWVPGNCQDVSTYLAICQRSQGLPFQMARYESYPSHFYPMAETGLTYDVDGFRTVRVCKIGSNPAEPDNSTYTTSWWAWHQVDLSPWGSTVYDACAGQLKDLNGNGYRNPPFDWTLGPPGFWQVSPANWVGLLDEPSPSAAVQFWGPYAPAISF